jgi:hypothetical protein
MVSTDGGVAFQVFELIRLNLQAIFYYLTVLFGCIVGQVFAVWKDFGGTRAFIRSVFPRWEDPIVHRMDFVLVSILGSILGMLLFRPTEYQQALFAGIGWVATIQALSQRQGSPIAAGPAAQVPPHPLPPARVDDDIPL